MEVTTRKIGEAGFIDLSGKLTVVSDSRALRESMHLLVENGARVVVVDLSNLERLDCFGVGQLVDLLRYARETGRKFGLFNVGRRHAQMLALLGVTDGCWVVDVKKDDHVDGPRAPRSRWRIRGAGPAADDARSRMPL